MSVEPADDSNTARHVDVDFLGYGDRSGESSFGSVPQDGVKHFVEGFAEHHRGQKIKLRDRDSFSRGLYEAGLLLSETQMCSFKDSLSALGCESSFALGLEAQWAPVIRTERQELEKTAREVVKRAEETQTTKVKRPQSSHDHERKPKRVKSGCDGAGSNLSAGAGTGEASRALLQWLHSIAITGADQLAVQLTTLGIKHPLDILNLERADVKALQLEKPTRKALKAGLAALKLPREAGGTGAGASSTAVEQEVAAKVAPRPSEEATVAVEKAALQKEQEAKEAVAKAKAKAKAKAEAKALADTDLKEKEAPATEADAIAPPLIQSFAELSRSPAGSGSQGHSTKKRKSVHWSDASSNGGKIAETRVFEDEIVEDREREVKLVSWNTPSPLTAAAAGTGVACSELAHADGAEPPVAEPAAEVTREPAEPKEEEAPAHLAVVPAPAFDATQPDDDSTVDLDKALEETRQQLELLERQVALQEHAQYYCAVEPLDISLHVNHHLGLGFVQL